jgi:hypothetical protein
MSTGKHPKPKHSHSEAEANFKWDDPLLVDDQLTEEERLIRDTARAYTQDKLAPRIKDAYLNEFQRDGLAWADRCHVARTIWLRRRKLCIVRPDRTRDRACRLRVSVDELGTVVARDVSDLRLW